MAQEGKKNIQNLKRLVVAIEKKNVGIKKWRVAMGDDNEEVRRKRGVKR